MNRAFYVGLLMVFLALATTAAPQIAVAAITQRGVATTGTTTNALLTISKPIGVVQGDARIRR